MTVILILLCMAIAGRELYLAFERKRTGNAPEIADIRTQLGALKGTRDELERFRAEQTRRLDALEAGRGERLEQDLERLAAEQSRENESLRGTDARVHSLVTQINERMVPEINARLGRQREAADALAAEVAELRGHLARRLDQAAATSLGADPADVVAGSLAVPGHGLRGPYERFAESYGMRVELVHPSEPGPVRYYLTGRSPRGLERDFLDLLHTLRTACDRKGAAPPNAAAQALLEALRGIGEGTVRLGPLLIVRTPATLVCGVLPLAELLKARTAASAADPGEASAHLAHLPAARRHDASRPPVKR
ncbi:MULTISPECIES: hypothetical protein [Actinomadura]|uniref:DNA recombination protein RmuC n=1 Tax=Actinomadura yumaensis TaxID=111807 RepID=A0ABW2D1H5_9ACTN|nr:hypothetical protein [Actinomadura sp. J1-007]MWK35467.1 hypothetical protein [Actinomadura sp. J1-007]